ncbi:MAG TPA: CopG family transcriptional regulator [Limnochordia bacterium]|nr:CopG family transcriptional regulator [Limnochordia bacterium]
MKRKQVYLTEKLDDGIKRLARGKGQTESELIREAIARYLVEETPSADPWRRLAGIATGGCADESSRVDEVVYGSGE